MLVDFISLSVKLLINQTSQLVKFEYVIHADNIACGYVFIYSVIYLITAVETNLYSDIYLCH